MGLEQSQVSKLERAVKFVDVWLFIDYVVACGVAPDEAMQQLTSTQCATHDILQSNKD
jgi:hypothetical protein